MGQPDPFKAAADILDPPKTGAAGYHEDPAGFIKDCFIWPEGKEPTAYQLNAIGLLPYKKRVATRGPHGLGKTAAAAWVIHWFALTRDALGEDWKIASTASVWRQLEKFLWPEVHKWSRCIDWKKIGRRPYSDDELLNLSIKLRTGEAFAVASDDHTKIEGAHADQILYIFDEAKAIPNDTFDAAEGAFSGSGDETDNEAYALAFSTPGDPQGHFYDIHKRKPGTEDWHAVHVTLEEAIKAGRVSRGWARQRARQWGEKSAVYINRVLGEFASSDENAVIPLSWVEAAVERWHERAQPPPHLTTIGADIARSGVDKTVLAIRRGATIEEMRRYSKQDTMETVGQIAKAISGAPITAVVDVIGIGAGVVDRLVEKGYSVEPFNASERTDHIDVSGELGFINKRAAAWWHLRELLDPASRYDPLSLPPDDLLIGDLTAPTWKVTSSGKIQIESKDDIKERIGRSTNDGDAVVQAFWPGEPFEITDIIEHYTPERIGADI